MIPATYFNGRDGKLHRVDLNFGRGVIDVVAPEFIKRFQRRAARLREPFADAPCIVEFADGSRCEVHEAEARRSLLKAMPYRRSFVKRCQDRWWGPVLAATGMALILLFAYFKGIPWAADRLALQAPVAWERKLGDEALAGLDKQLFQPTALAEERQQEARDVFARLVPADARMPMQLVFRNSPAVGPNAFALPNGTIVVTDALIYQIAGAGSELSGELADQLAGVLAHEIGHVQGRHAMRRVMQGSITGALSWALFGDFSAVAAGAPAMLLQLEYSRAMESEADEYAIGLLAQKGISPAPLADLFEALEARHKHAPQSGMPAWMRRATDYMSTHPGSDARIARLRQAAGQ
jgi:Zn-dependent protease with chaperone function